MDAEALYYAGRSHSGYSSGGDVDVWGDRYESDFDEMMDKMKESGEKWGPKQWFEAGKEYVATHPEPVVQPSDFLGGKEDRQESVPTPEVYSDDFSSSLFIDDEPIKVYDDYMLGADYDEYDHWEDNYMRPEERYWKEKPRDENYQPSNWEKRN